MRPDGRKIGRYRSYPYAVEKYSLSSRAGFDNVDLTLSGSLGNKIKLGSGTTSEVEVYSTDGKYIDLSMKYGDENFNVTPEQERDINAQAELLAKVEIFNQLYS